MRKIILTGSTLLLMAAAAYAQTTNTTTLSQTGTRNDADVQQTGNTQKATVTQSGVSAAANPKQRAMVRQSASGNESTINQQTGTSTTGNNSSNLAETYQTSSGNKATINQQDGSFFNEAKITQQMGIGNRAVIDQNKSSGGAGNGNKATVLQDGAGNINTSITQSNGSRKNEATINQFGDRNGTEQNGANLGGEVLLPPQTSIEQSNNSVNNKATITQGSTGGRVEKNSASVKQLESTDGEATVRQLSSDNYANIRQTGTYNRSTVLQQGGTNNSVESQALGNNNVETLEQSGKDNQIYIRFLPQNGGLGSAQNNSNIIDMKQTGEDNRSVADLRSSEANITVTQTGKGNFSRYQVRGDANTTTGGVGVNNDLTVVQDHNVGLGGTGNFFNGAVQGDNNTTNVTQTGEGNRFGTNRTTVHGLLIDGDGNTIQANQNGRQNVANMQIFGTASNDGNRVTINQTSPTAANTGNRIGTLNDGDETDERGLEISGNNNIVGLTQNGVGNSINMSIGNGAIGANRNQVAIEQTGNNNKVGTGGGTGGRGLFITGNDNVADIKQDGGDDTQAKQNGDDKLTVRQQNGMSSTGNLIKMDQGSGANTATITQNGDGNKVQGLGGMGTFGTQNGGNNEATITQTGVGTQGFGNVMSLNQTGMGNVIMSTQANP